MSDLAAAAAALGLPESLVERSAAARAEETGASAEDIIAAWAGGAPPPPATAQPAETSSPVATPSEPVEAAPAPTAAPVMATAPEISPEILEVPAPPYKAPTLVGATDNPANVLIGAIVLFVMMLLMGVVGPALQADNPGARSSEVAYSEAALDGQTLYKELGCVACHTQMVRPVIADVGLGAVTLNDTNQLMGTRRFGPDLSNAGARLGATEIQATIEGFTEGHPAYRMDSGDMSALVAYLAESVTGQGAS